MVDRPAGAVERRLLRTARRRIAGRAVLAAAAVYLILATLAVLVAMASAIDDQRHIGTVAFAAYEGVDALMLPASVLVPVRLVDAGDIVPTGLALMALAVVQAGSIALIGWLVLGGRPRRSFVLAVAVLVVSVSAVVLVRHETPLRVPDRGDPSVLAEERRLGELIAASGEISGERTTCRVRLLKQVGATSYVNAWCRHGISEEVFPVRVDGEAVAPMWFAGDKDERQSLPRDVRRALFDPRVDTQP